MFVENYLPPIPKGQGILAQAEVAGTSYRAENVWRFAYGENQSLVLEAEPACPHDENAIRVLGRFTHKGKTHTVHIGYIPREIAKEIIEGDYLESISPRLRRIWIGDQPSYCAVRFDLLADKDTVKRWKETGIKGNPFEFAKKKPPAKKIPWVGCLIGLAIVSFLLVACAGCCVVVPLIAPKVEKVKPDK